MRHFALSSALYLLLVTGAWTIGITQTTYSRILTPGYTISGKSTEFDAVSPLRCAVSCSQHPTCRAWATEGTPMICKLFTYIYPYQQPAVNSAILMTFGNLKSYFFINTDFKNITWEGASQACQAQGGVIAHDLDLEIMKMVIQVVQNCRIYVGVTYDSNDMVYKDYKGNLIPQELWKDGEPDGPPETIAQYRCHGQSFLKSARPDEEEPYPALCTWNK